MNKKQKNTIFSNMKRVFNKKIEPLPLKSRLIDLGIDSIGLVFLEKDVKSAVEWLKKELRKITLSGDIKNREILIDKAFEDCVK